MFEICRILPDGQRHYLTSQEDGSTSARGVSFPLKFDHQRVLTIKTAELKDNGVYKFIPINNETGENWFKFIVTNDRFH